MKKKKQGFSGERIIDISGIATKFSTHDKTPLSITFSKMGFFPEAKHQHKESEGDNCYILIYCISGRGIVTINEHPFSVRVGEFVFIPKNSVYGYSASKENPWSIYWFYFDGAEVQAILKFLYNQNNNSYKGFLEYNEERIRMFNVIYKNLKRGYSKDNLMLLNMCLLNFLTSLVYAVKKTHPEQKDKTQEVVDKAIEFMKKNESSNISLAQLALQLNLSVSHFSSVFKNKTGIAPVDYYNQLKIKKACMYLEHTDLLIKEIAFKIGIHDAAYFSRIFSKIIGVSPNVYRQSAIKN